MMTQTHANKFSAVASYMAKCGGLWESRKVSQTSGWYAHLVVLAPIQFLYLVLAFYKIDHQSLWTDEVISLNFAFSSEPLSSIWFKSQCPLYYTLLRLWVSIAGTTEFAFRTLSVLFGVAAVFLIYEIGSRLFNRKVAAIAATLFATSPFLIWYSQEARYVTLMLATSLFATYSFLRVVSTGQRGWWISYSVASVMASFSFVSVVFLFPAHFLYLLWSANHRSMVQRWVACQLVIFTLFLAWYKAQYGNPLAPAAAQQRNESLYKSVRWIPQETNEILDLVGPIPYTFFTFSAGFSIGPSLQELHLSRSVTTLARHSPTLLPLGVLFATLFVLGIRQMRRNGDSAKFLALWLAVPMMAVFLITVLTSNHLYNVRYVGIAMPAYTLILAAGIAGFRRAATPMTALAAILCFNGISLGHYYFDPQYAREDSRAAARYLESAASARDVIFAVGDSTALLYYYEGRLPIVPFDSRDNNRSASTEQLWNLGSKSHDRLWLVEVRGWQADREGKAKAALGKIYSHIDTKTFPGVNIAAYDLTRQIPR